MDYSEHTHCPNCFSLSHTAICPTCLFNRQAYLQHEAASHHLPLFSRLDKGYILGRVLGEGSFAIVYAAIREKDRLACAVKEYYPQTLAQRGLDGKTVKPKRNQEQLATWQNRFIQEGELLRCCYDYPSVESGVVRYTALVNQHNTAYLVMERLQGEPLGHYLTTHQTLSAASICLWLKPLLETLQKLHAKEIYHRDISPNNIFLCAADKPVLMDFGLARAGARDEVLKSSTLGAGTFIAPEQLSGGYCDQRTDLYALGAVIYLCLHGQAPPPVEARRQGAVLSRLNQPDSVSLALQTLATHCLQLDLAMRPKNVAQLLTELAPYWTTQIAASAALETIIPGQPYINPQPAPQVLQSPSAPQQKSGFAKFMAFTLKLALWAGLAYAGFIAYQNYTEQQDNSRKQDRRLFAKARTLEDLKAYLDKCVICEAKQDAMDKIAELEQKQQLKLEQQKQKKQEHLTYLQAQTADDLRAYLLNCVLCVDKNRAEIELEKLEAANKVKAQSQPSLLETVTKPIVDLGVRVIKDATTQAETELKAEIDAMAKQKAETEQRARASTEEKAKEKAKALPAPGF